VTAQEVLFWLFAAGIVGGAAGVIAARSPITSAMSLVATFFFLAGIYVLLWAHTIAVLQVLVYAGAIMVLFLFVIMLLNLGRPGPTDIRGPAGLLTAVVLAGALLLQLRVLSQATLPSSIQLPPGTIPALEQQQGIVGSVATPLFGAYLIPFEIASVLLLAAIVGAVVLAKRKL